MKPEQVHLLRQDFADLISTSTSFDADIPDTWMPSIRVMLSGMRKIKFARVPGVQGYDIAVRSIGVCVGAPHVGPPHDALDVVYHTAAPAKTSRAIRDEVRYAVRRCRVADLHALRTEHLSSVVAEAISYVRTTCRLGKPVPPSEVIITSAYADEGVRYWMPSWVVQEIGAWLKGGVLGDLTESEKSRFLAIDKTSE